MSDIVILDTDPLGLASKPRLEGEYRECFEWLLALVAHVRRVILQEIVDFEVPRELL
jgi:hypothetical protein